MIWSADAVQSEWVLSEANRAREDRKLVQVTTDKARLPMPFDTIQCADLAGWTGDADAPGWRKVVASVAELVGGGVPTHRSHAGRRPAAAAQQALHRRDAVRQPLRRSGAGVFRRRHGGGDHSALSRFKSMFVIASSSTLSFKGKAIGAQEAARQLGVRYVLEGSVRKAGSRVRIAVKLIDAVGRLANLVATGSRTRSKTCSPCRTRSRSASRA